MAIALLLLFLQSSFSFKKWTALDIYSFTSEDECEEINYDYFLSFCSKNTDLYGGPDACKDLLNSFVKGTCVKDDNADIDDLISKVDKSAELLLITIGYESKVITVDFSKLPNKMDVVIFCSSSDLKIKGNHGDKLLSLYAESNSLEIIESDLSIDTFILPSEPLVQSEFKVKAKQLNANVAYFPFSFEDDTDDLANVANFPAYTEGDTDNLANIQYDTLMFYDESYYLDEKLKKYKELDGNFVSFEFGKSSYEYISNFHGDIHCILPIVKSNEVRLTTGAQNLTLIASPDSEIPDSCVFDFRYYKPEETPWYSLYPTIFEEEEGGEGEEGGEEEAKLLEEYKIVITKSGDWTGLKKPKITIKANEKITVDTSEIKDIAEITVEKEEINTDNGNGKKKGLETKYIIVIVVCVVVVVAAVVGVVVFFVLKKKKQEVQNNSASP